MKHDLLRSNTFITAAKKVVKKDTRVKIVQYQNSEAILLETIGTHDEVY